MNSDSIIHVLIVEDHAVVRAGLRQLLQDMPDIQVIDDVERGEDAIRIVQEQVPDVVLLDLVLDTSQVTGLDTVKRIVASSPSTRVVVLSAYSDDEHVFPALRHGAIGYMLKRARLTRSSRLCAMRRWVVITWTRSSSRRSSSTCHKVGTRISCLSQNSLNERRT